MAGVNLAGKKILVTGAGRGLGRAISKALVEQDGKVFALNRTTKHLDSLKEECPSVTTIAVDLSDWNETRRELEKLEPMDGLVNNASMYDNTVPDLEVTKEMVYQTFDNNLLSAINCIQIIGRGMMNSGRGGSIINISSFGTTMIPIDLKHGALAYTVSKVGLEQVTREFAAKLGPCNIRVNTIIPCLMRTDLTESVFQTFPEIVEKIKKETPLQKLLTTEDMAGPVMYYLSDWSSMVTGTTHLVDGGRNIAA